VRYNNGTILRACIGIAICTRFLAAQVQFTQENGRIRVDIDGRPFTAFYANADTTKPFLHPLRTTTGLAVTRFYPTELAEGERTDHVHQRGLWFGHGNVNGFDFWANDASQQGKKRGRIVTAPGIKLTPGRASGTIDAKFDWVDSNGHVLLKEVRRMTFYSDAERRTVDFDIQLTAQDQVKFGDTKEGTFGMRLAPWLEEAQKDAPRHPKRTGIMTNAEGLSGEQAVWGKPSPWLDYSGNYEGEQAGIAVFDHPENPRYPAYWHVRGYGLLAANIFGLHDFTRDKSKDGSLTLEPRGTLRFRYRVVIHSGDAEAADLKKLYSVYTAKSKP